MTSKKPILPYDCVAATSIVGAFLRKVAPLLSQNTTLENFYACEPWDSYAKNPDGTETHIGYWGVSYKTDQVVSVQSILKLAEDPESPVWIEDVSLSGDSRRFYFILKLAMCGELEPEPIEDPPACQFCGSTVDTLFYALNGGLVCAGCGVVRKLEVSE